MLLLLLQLPLHTVIFLTIPKVLRINPGNVIYNKLAETTFRVVYITRQFFFKEPLNFGLS